MVMVSPCRRILLAGLQGQAPVPHNCLSIHNISMPASDLTNGRVAAIPRCLQVLQQRSTTATRSQDLTPVWDH